MQLEPTSLTAMDYYELLNAMIIDVVKISSAKFTPEVHDRLQRIDAVLLEGLNVAKAGYPNYALGLKH